MVGIVKKPETVSSSSRHADINIFTVASGLLYEVSMRLSSQRGGYGR